MLIAASLCAQVICSHSSDFPSFQHCKLLLCLTAEKIPGDNHLPPGIECKKSRTMKPTSGPGSAPAACIPVAVESWGWKSEQGSLPTICFGISTGVWLESAWLENCLLSPGYVLGMDVSCPTTPSLPWDVAISSWGAACPAQPHFSSTQLREM